MSDYIEIWERVGFSKGEAVTWERSFDRGKTWEPVNWPSKPPFIGVNLTPEVNSLTQTQLMSREEAEMRWPGIFRP